MMFVIDFITTLYVICGIIYILTKTPLIDTKYSLFQRFSPSIFTLVPQFDSNNDSNPRFISILYTLLTLPSLIVLVSFILSILWSFHSSISSIAWLLTAFVILLYTEPGLNLPKAPSIYALFAPIHFSNAIQNAQYSYEIGIASCIASMSMIGVIVYRIQLYYRTKRENYPSSDGKNSSIDVSEYERVPLLLGITPTKDKFHSEEVQSGLQIATENEKPLFERKLTQMKAVFRSWIVFVKNRLRFDTDFDTRPKFSTPPSADSVSALSLLSFSWIRPVLEKGIHGDLEKDDVEDLHQNNCSQRVGPDIFDHAWNDHAPSLPWALTKAFGLELLIAGAIKLANDLCNFAAPLVLQEIIRFMTKRDKSMETGDGTASGNWYDGFDLVVLLTLTYVLQSALFNQYFTLANVSSIRARAALNWAVFGKSLRLSAESRALYPSGAVQNLVSTDARRISELIQNLNMLWSCVLQIFVALILLVRLLGLFSAMVGLSVLILASPIQARILDLTRKIRDRAMIFTDQRVKQLSEVLYGIKLVKLYAWERAFSTRLGNTRIQELVEIRKAMVLLAFNSTIVGSLPIILSAATFATFALSGRTLDAALIFPAIALFNVLRPPLIILPNLLTALAQVYASVSRIEAFLMAEELPSMENSTISQDKRSMSMLRRESVSARAEQESQVEQLHDEGADIDVLAMNACFAWEKQSGEFDPLISDFNLIARKGDLVAIIGPTSSGKSSLISGLLGEAYLVGGSARLRSGTSKAFVDQTAFILNGTIRENVLFGLPFDESRYHEAIKVASLIGDLELLPAGEWTEIGARGVNLSGGQKQRVAIARAVYANADVYFMDDPLSALDAHVGRAVFDSCITGSLAGKTRILVTNQLHLLASRKVHRIISLSRDGTIEAQGSFEELINDPAVLPDSFAYRLRDYQLQEDTGSKTSEELLEGISLSTEQPIYESEQKEKTAKEKQQGQLTKKEERSAGAVDMRLYWLYVQACGGWILALFVIILAVVAQGFQVGSGYWLSIWSQNSMDDALNAESAGVGYYLGVYVLLGGVSLIFSAIGSILLAFCSVNASTSLHERMLKTVLAAPMSWFDSTPSGRILNRFSTDMDKVDNTVSSTLQTFLRVGLAAVGTLALVVYVTPAFIVPLLIVGALFLRVQAFYRLGSVELRRLEAITRSPLYNLVGEASDGLATVRAFGKTRMMEVRSMKITDEVNKLTVASACANRWLAVRLELLSTALIFFSAALSVLSNGAVSPSLAGLVLSNSTQLTGVITWTVRTFSDTEQQMSSVERIEEYAEAPPMPSEESSIQLARQPKKGWPRLGTVSFDNVFMRYRDDLPFVLQGVTFSANTGERIGIVGKTGGGKSSLLQALFRLTPVTEGTISIDGVDVSSVGLHELRSSIGIIPQEAFVFSGTIRYNLDPFGEHSDDDLWTAVKSSGLAEHLSEVGLDSVVAEQGSNLSVGKRQLLSLARALLRNPPILVLDEATAAVDIATDEHIQKALREESTRSRCTTLTIAHRINTIMDSDKILVMDKGKIAEFGSPDELSKIPGGIFASLVQESMHAQEQEESKRKECPELDRKNSADLFKSDSKAHCCGTETQQKFIRAVRDLREIILNSGSDRQVQELESVGMPPEKFRNAVHHMIHKLAAMSDAHLLVPQGSSTEQNDNFSVLPSSTTALIPNYAFTQESSYATRETARFPFSEQRSNNDDIASSASVHETTPLNPRDSSSGLSRMISMPARLTSSSSRIHY